MAIGLKEILTIVGAILGAVLFTLTILQLFKAVKNKSISKKAERITDDLRDIKIENIFNTLNIFARNVADYFEQPSSDGQELIKGSHESLAKAISELKKYDLIEVQEASLQVKAVKRDITNKIDKVSGFKIKK